MSDYYPNNALQKLVTFGDWLFDELSSLRRAEAERIRVLPPISFDSVSGEPNYRDQCLIV
jgi:hypothetical protein